MCGRLAPSLMNMCIYFHLSIFIDRDPSIVVVGFSWDSADEKKFRQTFHVGRSIMRRFIDLQAVASMLGYQNYGLNSLSRQVMGLTMGKSKKVMFRLLLFSYLAVTKFRATKRPWSQA